MVLWLAQLAVFVFVGLALHLTIAAFRARNSTPRTVSLALSVAACVAVVIAAINAPLPNLCRGEPATVRPGDLEAELARWSWWLTPCSRLEVVAGPQDLQSPLDLGKLTRMAVAAGVVVDVALERGVRSRAPQIDLWVRRADGKGSRIPVGTPIPGPYTDRVYPRLGDLEDLTCAIDDGVARSNGTLDELLVGPPESYLGFHRLRCWQPGDDEAAAITAYIDISDAGVGIASSEMNLNGASGEIDCARASASYSEFEPTSGKSYGLALATRMPEKCAILPDSPAATASMLVLDRPQKRESCELAEGSLRRGATVVVALPGDEFLDRCRDLLPAVPVTSDRNVDLAPMARWPGEAKGIIFDRTPRLTFVLDNTLDALPLTPTCVVLDEGKPPCFDDSVSRGPSSGYQLQEARKLCNSTVGEIRAPSTACQAEPVAIGARTDELDTVMYLRRSPFPARQTRDLALLERTTPSSTLAELGGALVQNEARVYWENEVVVVFSHDRRGKYGAEAFVERFGSQVRVVALQDPYGISLSTLSSPTEPAILRIPPGLMEGTASRVLPYLEACSSNPRARCAPPMDDLLFDRKLQTETIAPERGYSRFVRRGEEGRTRAPVRFGWYERPGEPPATRLPPVQLAHTATDSGIAERLLAAGAMVGRGHLLLLGYSPFETNLDAWQEVLDGDRRELREMQFIEQLYAGTEDILADVNGPVLSVAPQADGGLWVTVVRDLDTQALDALEFQAKNGEPIVAPLVDFDAAGRTFTYALPAAELRRLRACEPLRAKSPGAASSRPIYACPPGDPEATQSRWGAALALEQLAHYTGGTFTPAGAVRAPLAPNSLHTRTLGLGVLAGILLFAWGRRAVRRLAGLRAYRRLRRIDAIAQRRYDPPEAVVAAAGDWDGRTSTWPRTGAFGGYRPLEPGDRASAIVLHDLVIREQQGTQVLPRVALRIEEASPAVLVLVNLGQSMRVPERTDSSKALFAGRIAAHVAASAWKIGGEVALYAVGIEGESEILAPVRLGPGHEEIERSLRGRLRQRPARDGAPWLEELSECGAVVYVSDFQTEDERQLQAWVSRLEGEGIRVGGIMLYSPFEFTMIEGGRLAGSGVWADRADWDPDDLFDAFGRRRDQVERIFEGRTTGGLVVVATNFGQDDIELALEGGRLLQILR